MTFFKSFNICNYKQSLYSYIDNSSDTTIIKIKSEEYKEYFKRKYTIKKELWERKWYVIPNQIVKIFGIIFGSIQGHMILDQVCKLYYKETQHHFPKNYKLFVFIVPLAIYYYSFNIIAQILGYTISLLANYSRGKINFWTRPVYDFIHYTSIIIGIVLGIYKGIDIQDDAESLIKSAINSELPWIDRALVFAFVFCICCYTLKIAGHHMGFYINSIVKCYRNQINNRPIPISTV